MKHFIFYLIFLLSIVSCKKEEVFKTSLYFPLHVGDTWHYNNGDVWKIVGIKDTLGKQYFKMQTNTSQVYYRVENGKVYSLGIDNSEYIRFNMNLDEGDTWYYNENITYDFQWKASLCDKADITLVNGNKVTGCFCFCYDIEEMIDDEYSVWLAPDIGIVRMTCGECMAPVTDLLWAEIDGEMIFNN